MNSSERQKINRLLGSVPPGTVALSSWLRQQGFSLQLQRRYRLSRWFSSIGTGAMIRDGDQVGYQGAVYALQRQAGLPVHIGGKTALALLGKGHFLELSPAHAILFGSPGVKLPTWFIEGDWGIEIDYHRTSFLPAVLGTEELDVGGFSVRLSSAARATMECLYLASGKEELTECRELMDGLNNLRPSAVQNLLEASKSVRVNRLFLFLADLSGHAWSNHIDRSRIRLGKGKRSLVKDGAYVSKYQMIVPRELVPAAQKECKRNNSIDDEKSVGSALDEVAFVALGRRIVVGRRETRAAAPEPYPMNEEEGQPEMTFNTESKGVYAIATTPFLEDGSIDFNSIDKLTDFYEQSGCTGITILGIMGEAQKLEAEESRAIVKRVVSRAKVPVIVGVSAPGFAAMRSVARQSMDLGAAGVMIAPAPALRTDDQIVNYFGGAVEAVGDDVPWVLQDYPLTLTVVMSPSAIAKIITNHPSCLMLKHEDWPGLEKISTLRSMQKTGELRAFSILCGNGGMFLDFEPERGADGAMTGYGFPDMLTELVGLFAAGKRDEAHDLFDAHLPLIRYEQQLGVGLAVRKHVLKRRGVIATVAQRKPAQLLSAAGKAEVDYLLTRLARFDKRASL
ncbi:hypothetical protein EHS39_32675 [Ensifer sp. MPMI2T]|nr:hypothetical protein EHS39_32675 [Ensifer sp. MPMI2T]